MTPLFLDSSFAIAARYKRDQRHGDVVRLWPQLLGSGVTLITTSFVVDEIVTFLNVRGRHTEAVRVGATIIENSNIELIHVQVELFMASWGYFIRHQDKRYSLTDCISFVVMQQRGLRQALTFDQHFAQAGFECVPPLAESI